MTRVTSNKSRLIHCLAPPVCCWLCAASGSPGTCSGRHAPERGTADYWASWPTTEAAHCSSRTQIQRVNDNETGSFQSHQTGSFQSHLLLGRRPRTFLVTDRQTDTHQGIIYAVSVVQHTVLCSFEVAVAVYPKCVAVLPGQYHGMSQVSWCETSCCRTLNFGCP